MRGQIVSLDDDQRSSVVEQVQMNAVSSVGEQISIPSVGLDVPLGEVSEVDGSIVPPGFTEVYRDRDRGTDYSAAASGTVYLFTHALRGGGVAPGNYLIDVDSQTSKVENGATIQVAGLTYVVESSSVVDKETLPTLESVWSDTPGRLVLVTCMQKVDGSPSTQNLLISATLE